MPLMLSAGGSVWLSGGRSIYLSVIERVPEFPRRLRVLDGVGEARVSQEVLVAVPFDASDPAAFVSLGRTDAEGVLDVRFLPDGSYQLRVWEDGDRNLGVWSLHGSGEWTVSAR